MSYNVIYQLMNLKVNSQIVNNKINLKDRNTEIFKFNLLKILIPVQVQQ